ncbi:MAG: UDP-N-acetylglucosamine 2-epimerase (non-hydrolyzing) [Bdellovibrionales bacterium]|nr:UDP-N-acetylglucosamine 2-epimerase (non-hydrolyzing) [Bdellovibrionales bacterium]
MKIITVVGARPQFIKAAVVSRAFNQHKNINELIIHTGQHYDQNMSDIFFEEMSIPKPNFYLKVGGKTHGSMTGQMLEKIEEVLLQEKPHLVLVYGDTNSTISGALAAAKLHIPVAHVEAGLRSFNMSMPEEINRILTDKISNVLFCPSETSKNNLLLEGTNTKKIEVVGDVMYDAVIYYLRKAVPSNNIKSLISKNYFLATIHRAENTDNEINLSNIFEALREISKLENIILPLHPRTKKFIDTYNIDTQGITLIEPVGYYDMLLLLNNSNGVFTDSGGLQKEAYFLSKPCITLRGETEWTETVDSGCNFICGTDKHKIIASYEKNKTINFDFTKNLYGNGDAGVLIAEKILNSYS